MGAMAAAANYAFANRQVMTHWARQVFERYGTGLRTVYDVCHQAVEFEDVAQSMSDLGQAGIPILKFQIA